MILRNLTSIEQTVVDGPHIRIVPPQGLVTVTTVTGFVLLSNHPATWCSEPELEPPPPD